MQIPEQVQAQANKADELMKGASGPEQPLDGSQPKPEDLNAKPPEGPKPEETVGYWKQKYSVLQGKYDAEIVAIRDNVNLVNDLKHQNRQLQGQLTESNRLIADLQKQITEKPKAEKVDTGDPLSALSDEDRQFLREEGFEGRTLEILGKLVKANAPAAAPTAPAEDLNKARQDEENRARQAEITFWKEMNEKVQDWEAINKSELFNSWLDNMIPYSNQTRREKLIELQGHLDYYNVIKMFNDFKATLNPEEPKKEDTMQIDPNKHIEPDASVGHREPTDPAPQGKIWTRQEIQDFYNDVTRGKYRGKEEERASLDADILKANVEGRIRG